MLSIENSPTCSEDENQDLFNRSLALDTTDLYLLRMHYQLETADLNELAVYFPQNEDQRKIVNEFPPLTFYPSKPKETPEVPLSTSVGVLQTSPPNVIQVVEELEARFKPRYKSDYFPQDGKTRPPRYVTDCHGNHCVQLQIPADLQGWIRVDWVTVLNELGARYCMPYQFQVNHRDPTVLDVNPIYLAIPPNHNGLLKLHLVLIKSKQERVAQVQPFPLFPPHEPPQADLRAGWYPAKELIKTFQLGSSQLAFTYYSLNTDGQTYTPHWNTTVYSSIMREETTKKRKKTCCPNCKTEIEITELDIDDETHEKSTKRKR